MSVRLGIICRFLHFQPKLVESNHFDDPLVRMTNLQGK